MQVASYWVMQGETPVGRYKVESHPTVSLKSQIATYGAMCLRGVGITIVPPLNQKVGYKMACFKTFRRQSQRLVIDIEEVANGSKYQKVLVRAKDVAGDEESF